jgi:hypothetical protein
VGSVAAAFELLGRCVRLASAWLVLLPPLAIAAMTVMTKTTTVTTLAQGGQRRKSRHISCTKPPRPTTVPIFLPIDNDAARIKNEHGSALLSRGSFCWYRAYHD